MSVQASLSSSVPILIFPQIILPWFLIAVFVVSIVYYELALFYRSSARELKRLGTLMNNILVLCIRRVAKYFSDAILRSSLYSHFSESLSGLATIRAYGETERFRVDNEKRVNIENR